MRSVSPKLDKTRWQQSPTKSLNMEKSPLSRAAPSEIEQSPVKTTRKINRLKKNVTVNADVQTSPLNE